MNMYQTRKGLESVCWLFTYLVSSTQQRCLCACDAGPPGVAAAKGYQPDGSTVSARFPRLRSMQELTRREEKALLEIAHVLHTQHTCVDGLHVKSAEACGRHRLWSATRCHR